jgi:apolipoprotein N-acyltransferase
VPLVFGAYDTEDGREFNAAIFLEPEGPARTGFDVYRKASLFPLTERVPAWLDFEPVRRSLPWLGTWSPGSGPAVLALDLPDGRRLRVAPLICYDAVDPEVARGAVREGADLLLTLSNDSWFAEGAGPRLHLVTSAFRSIETRRPQVRVTNTGISAVIDATGEIRNVLGVHVRGSEVAAVPPGAGETSFLTLGGALGPLALAAGVALVLPAGPRRASLPTRPRADR